MLTHARAAALAAIATLALGLGPLVTAGSAQAGLGHAAKPSPSSTPTPGPSRLTVIQTDHESRTLLDGGFVLPNNTCVRVPRHGKAATVTIYNETGAPIDMFLNGTCEGVPAAQKIANDSITRIPLKGDTGKPQEPAMLSFAHGMRFLDVADRGVCVTYQHVVVAYRSGTMEDLLRNFMDEEHLQAAVEAMKDIYAKHKDECGW
ncbi:hypothetical protein [Nonomuraea typhae]|uniref:Uncharacterized protein n=1 Tax=Nonomuraea typhae TaxID=2603600 RepID=A0ABW7ZCH3_9ACTN